MLTANNVLSYVSDTLPCPPTTIGTGDVILENHAFLAYKRQYNYVLLALFGTCGPEAQIVMSFTTSFANAMLRLIKAYGNQFHTRIMFLKERLSSITKGDSNVGGYLHSICSIIDELALIGHSVEDLNLVIVALNEFCTVIRTRDTPLLFDELFYRLVDYEIFLQREKRQQSFIFLS